MGTVRLTVKVPLELAWNVGMFALLPSNWIWPRIRAGRPKPRTCTTPPGGATVGLTVIVAEAAAEVAQGIRSRGSASTKKSLGMRCRLLDRGLGPAGVPEAARTERGVAL